MDNEKKKALKEQYKNRHPQISEDHTDDLKILLMDFLEEHPNAKPMRVKFNL